MLGLLSLSRRERESFYSIQSDTARSEWLIDRFAAKDAVRMLVKKMTGVSLFPADIEISGDVRHRPKVEGKWSEKLGVKPAVVVGRHNGATVAVAGLDPEQVERAVSGFNPA
jgi:hypothetical protein